MSGATESVAAEGGDGGGGATEKEQTNATNNNNNNNNANFNRNNYSSTDDDDDNDDDDESGADGGSRRFMSAWREIWKDLEPLLRVAPDISSCVELENEQLMKFPDDSVQALAESLVGDIYMSVSTSQNDPEIVLDHQNRLVSSLVSAIDIQPQGLRRTVRTIRNISGIYSAGIHSILNLQRSRKST